MKHQIYQNFTKKDLKVGYIVKAGDCLHMLMESTSQGLVLVDKRLGWLYLSSYDDNLDYINPPTITQCDFTITEVYGFSRFATGVFDLSTDHRELLWKRGEPIKKMTVEEIEKELGYKVEIIS